jgi:2,4-diaminopentanoate dehydrogenase
MVNKIANKPRIMIYGVGQYGSLAAKIAIKKGFPVVGAVNRAGDKVGQDLGRVIGLERDIGVIIEDLETADYRAMDADVAIETTVDRLKDAFPGYERLLSAGINVITLAAQATYAEAAAPDLAARIDALGKANNATFTGSSLWDMSRVWTGIIVTGPCTDIEALHHKSVTNLMPGGVHALDYCGIGISQEEFAERVRDEKSVGGFYSLNVRHVLHHLGYQVTSVNEYNEPVLFNVPVDCPPLSRVIEPGICAGTRIVSEIKTEQGLTATLHTELRLLLKGETEYTEWTVDGRPNCTIRVDRRDSVYASSASMFNRIPDVVAAEPGIRLFSEFGPLRHTALIPNVE